MYHSISTVEMKVEESNEHDKKNPHRGSNWSDLLSTEFHTGIYKIPCHIIYIPFYFNMSNNGMFLLITDGRQISVIQLFWNKPFPTSRLVTMPLRLSKTASSVFKDKNVFNLPYFSHQFSKFSSYYFLSP